MFPHDGETLHVAADTPADSATSERAGDTTIAGYLRVAVTPIALYLFSAVLLLFRIGGHPNYNYNWESYTAWEFFPFWEHPTRHIFGLTDGLMTDSGRSPLIILPAWLGFQLGGAGLTSLRVPIALIAALAVPLVWLAARRLTTLWTATLAAALLAVAPAFILYARTATVVGISVAPALLTVYALLRVLQRPTGWNWGWLIALQILLIADSYAYAPIRFLWPMSVVLFLGEIIWRRGLRWRFAIACLVTAIVLPAVLILIDEAPGHNPRAAIKTYYNGRGEQILSLHNDPAGYKYYLRNPDAEAAAATEDDSSTQLAFLLIKQNTKDLANLLLDHDRRPAITDYWNPHGRLYPWFLVPFFLLGMGASLWRIPHHVEDRLLLALFWGFSLPMIVTSQVHIGRLIFAMPFLFIFVAIGIVFAAGWLTSLVRRLSAGIDPRITPVGLAVALFLVTSWSAWRDYRIAANPSRDANIIAQLRTAAPTLRATHGSAALVTGGMNQVQVEAISTAGYRLDLNDDYAFVDLAAGEHAPANDARPTLYFGGLLDQLPAPGAPALPCDTVYYVNFSIHTQFLDTVAASRPGCLAPPHVETLAN
ncbi:MAG TPA: glycosyltransferase family 39 protein [Thermomicrobiales bacterium]|nr:glycosyltransferase family 39 protein [Thermomicrobiales bacterium]